MRASTAGPASQTSPSQLEDELNSLAHFRQPRLGAHQTRLSYLGEHRCNVVQRPAARIITKRHARCRRSSTPDSVTSHQREEGPIFVTTAGAN